MHLRDLYGIEDDVDEIFEPKRGKGTRTNIDWSLIGIDDEDEGNRRDDED